MVGLECGLMNKAYKQVELIRRIADDAGTFHLAMAGRVVHHRIVLCVAVVPNSNAVGLPAPAHLVFRNHGLRDQVLQQACWCLA